MQLQITPGAPDNTLFNDLIDQFEEDIVIVDMKGTILNLNKSLLEAWGGTRADYVGKTCGEVQKPELACFNSQSFFDRVLQEGQRVSETYTDVTPDGRMNYYHVNAFPLRDANGEICRLVLTRRNTTAEMQIEQRLYQSQKMVGIGERS
ncbi:MAG: PAS domain-containing protein, partial [Deltaproteobacteria bacterium]|nr:PAS domain-containing protein [Deltaproteobacteria bacterium]